MPDISILDPAVHAAPKGYTVKGAQEIILRCVSGSFDGTSAAGSFVPAVQVVDPSGFIVGTYVLGSTLVAGASADVSWFPLRKTTTSAGPAPPNPISDLFAWYDFSDTSTLSLNGSGGIFNVTDKSGNGHTLTSSSSATSPTTTSVNGRPAALFSTANQTQLTSADFSVALAQPGTVFGVFTVAQTTDGTHFPGIWDSATHATRWALFQNGPFNQLAIAGGAGGGVVRAITAPYSQQQVTAVYNGASSAIRVNGNEVDGTVNVNTLSSIALGNQPGVGGQNDYLTGAICEILYYKVATSASVTTAAESYLKAKWGTP